MLSKRKAKNIINVLSPCLKKTGKDEKSYRFNTLYGKKNLEGLINTLIDVSYQKGEHLGDPLK